MKTIRVTHTQAKNENEVTPSGVPDITDGSVDVLEIGNTLDFVEKRDELLAELINKIRYDGTIEIVGTDIYDVARGLHYAYLDLNDVESLLYSGRQSCDTIQNVVHSLESQGLTINIKRLLKYTYYVKATRKKQHSH